MEFGGSRGHGLSGGGGAVRSAITDSRLPHAFRERPSPVTITPLIFTYSSHSASRAWNAHYLNNWLLQSVWPAANSPVFLFRHRMNAGASKLRPLDPPSVLD